MLRLPNLPIRVLHASQPRNRLRKCQIFPSDDFSSKSDTNRRPRQPENTDAVRVGLDRPIQNIEQGPQAEAQRPCSPASSDGESTISASMSASDQKLHVVMKEMIRVLKIPTSAETTTDQSSRQSFKKHSVAGASRSRDFPEFPVDRCCADRIQTLAAVKKWCPFVPRDTRPFRVPREDLTSSWRFLNFQIRQGTRSRPILAFVHRRNLPLLAEREID